MQVTFPLYMYDVSIYIHAYTQDTHARKCIICTYATQILMYSNIGANSTILYYLQLNTITNFNTKNKISILLFLPFFLKTYRLKDT